MRWVLRWQRPLLAAAFVLLLIAAVLGAASGGGDGEPVQTATGPTTTSTSTTRTPMTAGATGSTTTATTVPGSSATTGTTSTTRPVRGLPRNDTPAPTEPEPEPTAPTTDPPPTTPTCRNSTDPACGPFHWDPVPANQPLAVTVDWEREGPLFTTVKIKVNAMDPDAQNIEICVHGIPGDETVCPAPPGPAAAPGYGPWTPPSPVSGQRSKTYEVNRLGPFEIYVVAWSWLSSPGDLYSSTYGAPHTEGLTAGHARGRAR